MLGLVTQVMIAWLFGTTAASDAYFVALGFVTSLMNPLGATLTYALIPMLSHYLAREGEEATRQATAAAMGMVAVVFLAGALASAAAAGVLVQVLAPGFDPPARKVATDLLRIMSPALFFLGIGGVVTALCHARRHFVIPTIAGWAIDTGIILAALAFSARLGVRSLALGLSLGSAAHAVVPLAILARRGHLGRLTPNFAHPAVRLVLRAIPSTTLAGSVLVINLMLDRAFASALASGWISALEFGMRVVFLPVTLFAQPISRAVFPLLSSLGSHETQREKFAETLSLTLRLVVWVGVPSTVGLVVLRQPLVRVLFQRGSFGAASTDMTAAALLYYSLGIAAYMLYEAVIRAHYSLGNLGRPLKAGCATVAVNVVANLILGYRFGARGIALGTSLASAVGVGIMLEGLRERLALMRISHLLAVLLRTGAASAAMAVVCRLLWRGLGSLPGSWGREVIALGAAVVAGGAVFAAVSSALGGTEWITVRTLVLGRRSQAGGPERGDGHRG